jgi:hypothetical protein
MLSLLNAQSTEVQISGNRTIREDISDAQAETIRLKMTDLLGEYQKKGALVDAESGEVTLLASNQFKDLFRIDARHFVDFRDRPEQVNMSINDYKNGLMNAFGYDFFKFEVGNAIIQEITPTEGGSVLVEIIFTKRVDNQQGGRGSVKDLTEEGGKKFVLRMDVEFDENLEDYSITGVECTGNCTTVAAPRETYIAGSVGLVQPFIGGEPLDSTEVSFSETWGHKLGLSYMTNVFSPADAEHKRLFASVGAGYQFWTETAMVDASNSATEVVTLHMLRVPLGLSYRIAGDEEQAIHMEVQAVPSVSFSTTKRFGSQSGIPELQTTTGLWLQASPTFYKEFVRNEPAIGFQVSLDLGFNVISPFGKVEGTEAINMPRDRTIVNDEVKIHYIGLRVGVNIHSSRSVN